MIRGFVVAALIGAAAVTAVGAAPSALAERPYKNCTEAHQDGRYDIPQGDDAYWSGGDRDGDGYACES
ncbi:excalibur calcium-binding domain-containing protein [Mycolicibacterium komossense]|uniref:excalibur calcium-binding domain-containing protein n=1 Tax=Mycolicibacterium komossense TaxID=1779 RepID=UPI003F4963D1